MVDAFEWFIILKNIFCRVKSDSFSKKYTLNYDFMENIIYNELRSRGCNVDVGLIEIGGKNEDGKFVRKQLEVDFVINRPPNRVYIQSAFHMPTPEKEYHVVLCYQLMIIFEK